MIAPRSALPALAFLGGIAVSLSAQADTCPNGGELTITAASDSLTIDPVPGTTFNFGEHVIVSAQATGFEISRYAWTIANPVIKDYSDDMGTKNSPTPSTPVPWSTTNLAAADLAAPTVGFYWLPLYNQNEPNNGPFTRNVVLRATKTDGTTCSVTATFTLVRNQTDINKQAEDYFTSNHRAATTTNPLFGHVIDEHIFWHQSVHDQTSFPVWTRFLIWHSEFVRRFALWRQTFGYGKVEPWYPGMPLPTGPRFDADPSLRLPYVADNNRMPTYYTLAGGTTADPWTGAKKLADYGSLDVFNWSFQGTFHSQVHCNIGTHDGNVFASSGVGYGSMCKHSSPKDPMFWRWHTFIDVLYRNYCAVKPGACPIPPSQDPPAEPWMADNNADVSSNGAEPSSSPFNASFDVWNRYDQVTTDACVGPLDTYGNRVTTGGVVRRCGSNLDNQNPMSGVTNYLYGRLRNTRPGSPPVIYAEVAAYYALTSSQLRFPTDFTMIPESRQFIALDTVAGVVTNIGPVPWTPPPVPNPGDQYTLYMRVLSVQATPPTEGAGIDNDVANNNNIVRTNINVVPAGP